MNPISVLIARFGAALLGGVRKREAFYDCPTCGIRLWAESNDWQKAGRVLLQHIKLAHGAVHGEARR